MQRELDARHLQLSSYCIQQIEQLVGRGVQRMRHSNAEGNTRYVLRGERNMRSLIKYLDDYARELGTHPHLDNNDFDAAMMNCPVFWPFSGTG